MITHSNMLSYQITLKYLISHLKYFTLMEFFQQKNVQKYTIYYLQNE